jgi:transcriptional regulator with XRE-family HTH domain
MRSARLNRAKFLALREDQGLTQPELGEKLSRHAGKPVHFTTISKWERGERQPSVRHWNAICKYFGLKRADLVDSGEQPAEAA